MEAECAFCQNSQGVQISGSSRPGYDVSCPRCGTYKTSLKAFNDAKYFGETDRAALSAWTKERSLKGLSPPALTSGLKSEDGGDLPVFDLREVIDTYAPKSILERLDKILVNLVRLSGEPGTKIALKDDDLYVFHATSVKQMLFFGQALAANGWITALDRVPQEIRVTVDGLNHAAALERAGPLSTQAFVAMAFHPELEPAWTDGLRPGISSTGFVPLRIDKREHNEKICDVIVAEIRKSALLVADFTLHRHGVYFEAGFALGLNIPVIWCCRKDDLPNCHFDTRQYNHIEWETPEELREKLRNRIEATVRL